MGKRWNSEWKYYKFTKEKSSAFIIEQRKEIQTLKEENKQLRNELNDCEKFRYTVFKRIGELVE